MKFREEKRAQSLSLLHKPFTLKIICGSFQESQSLPWNRVWEVIWREIETLARSPSPRSLTLTSGIKDGPLQDCQCLPRRKRCFIRVTSKTMQVRRKSTAVPELGSVYIHNVILSAWASWLGSESHFNTRSLITSVFIPDYPVHPINMFCGWSITLWSC